MMDQSPESGAVPLPSSGANGAPTGACNREACPVRGGVGQCALGHAELLDCPEYEPVEEEEVDAEDAPAMSGLEVSALASSGDLRGRHPIGDGAEPLSLSPCSALTVDEATALLSCRSALVVLPIGYVGTGKTTLLAGLYERLCLGPLGERCFAGSLSLLGFEERCFEASLGSGNSRARQDRTSRDAKRLFLHLTVQTVGAGLGSRRDLLMADISGEHLKELVTADEPGPLSFLLARTDVLALLVDGEGLADPLRRYSTITEARTALRAMIERSSVRDTARVVALVTKWDYCVGVADMSNIVSRLQAELESVVPDVRLMTCAARPDAGSELEEGTGTAEFLEATLEGTIRDPARLLSFGRADAPLALVPGGLVLEAFLSAGHPVP